MDKDEVVAERMLRGPLSGIRVLDLGQIYNGPYCCLLLSHLGAEVVKVEPLQGDATRQRVKERESAAFVLLGSNRRAMAVDLKASEGKNLFLRMVEVSDIVVENFGPGTMERLGLGFETLQARNPRIILGSGEGFDRDGPYGGFLAMDITVQALTAVMAVNGFPDDPPVKAGVAFADILGGVTLAVGVLAAVVERTKTGNGRHVRVAMQDAILPTLTSNIAGYLESKGTLPEKTGNRHGGLAVAPYNVYRCVDGWIAVFCVRENQWNALMELIGWEALREDRRNYETMPQRAKRIDEIDEILGSWTQNQAVHSVTDQLVKARIPCAPVSNLREIMESAWFARRGGMLEEVQHQTLGRTRAFGSPIRFVGSDRRETAPAPLLGEHTDDVLKDYIQLGQDEIERLRKAGVIR